MTTLLEQRAHEISNIFPQILLALVAIVVAARAVGMVFARIHQPPVMGEVVAGILVGPSFLGYVAPGISGQLFPGAINPMLSVIAQIGVILYMFIVGLQLDTELVRERIRASIAISQYSPAIFARIRTGFVALSGVTDWRASPGLRSR